MSDAARKLIHEIINVCAASELHGDDLLKALSTVYVSTGYVLLREQFSHEDICTTLLLTVAGILAQKELLRREPSEEEVMKAEAIMEARKSTLN